jgi:hypothetical protein
MRVEAAAGCRSKEIGPSDPTRPKQATQAILESGLNPCRRVKGIDDLRDFGTVLIWEFPSSQKALPIGIL